MGDYVLTCCSTADLSAERLKERNIPWAAFHYEIDGVMHADDLWATITPDEFYARMAAGALTRTSQVSPGEFVEFFEQFAKQGLDILHISFSSALSGASETAVAASILVKEHYPEVNIKVIDSLCASTGYGLLMEEAADMRDAGMGMDELAQWVMDNRRKVHHWFFSTDLSSYVRGGRISKAAGLVGTALKICPLLNVSDKGALTPREKIRTKKKAMAATLDRMIEHAQDGLAYSKRAYICHSACLEDARELATKVEKTFPSMQGPVEIYSIGTTIGSHTGPGTISLFFWGDERVD